VTKKMLITHIRLNLGTLVFMSILFLNIFIFFQLILGCAVNCDHKQEYIENIMSMDASSQQLIMQAIQEILNLPVRPLTFWYHREIRLECRCLQKCFLIWNYYECSLWAPPLVLIQSKGTVFWSNLVFFFYNKSKILTILFIFEDP